MSPMISSLDLVHIVIEEIWNLGELELADTLFSNDYVNHGGLIPDLIRGPEAIKFSVALYRSAFPAFEVAIDDLSEDNGAVVVRWVAHHGPRLTDRPASRLASLQGITRCRLQGGKIAESWTVWDSRAALARCGALKRTLIRHLGDDVGGRESRIRK